MSASTPQSTVSTSLPGPPRLSGQVSQSTNIPLEQDDGSINNIKMNEFNCALAVSNGKRNPTAAGVRMGNTKFMMIKHEAEDNTAYLSR